MEVKVNLRGLEEVHKAFEDAYNKLREAQKAFGEVFDKVAICELEISQPEK